MTAGRPAGLDGPGLADLEALLRDECGLTLADGIRGSLGPSVTAAAAGLGLPLDAFLRRLGAHDARAIAALVDHAVVAETYFFRHPEHFRVLADRLLPALADRASLRIWSAGCASGEEPYSLAIALLEAGRAPGADLVLGTDVSERLLARARVGRYGRWSFRHLAPALLERYFRAGEETFAVAERVRRAVTFRRHNLVAEPPPLPDCDLIVCRNVLIYFAPELARRVLAGFVDALRPGGALLVGPAETPLAIGLDVEWEELDGASLFRRPVAGTAKPPPRSGANRRGDPSRRPHAPARWRPAPVESPAGQASAVPAPEAPPPPAPSAPAPDPGASAAAGGAALPAYDRALRAARDGRFDEALALANEAARELSAPAHLLVALLADAGGDAETALAAVRRALYLDAGDALAHATLARLLDRAGRPEEARRSRSNARLALADRPDDEPLPGPAPLTVGALRRALGPG